MKNTITLKSNYQASLLIDAIFLLMQKSEYYASRGNDWIKELAENEINTIKPLLDQLRQINIPEE